MDLIATYQSDSEDEIIDLTVDDDPIFADNIKEKDDPLQHDPLQHPMFVEEDESSEDDLEDIKIEPRISELLDDLNGGVEPQTTISTPLALLMELKEFQKIGFEWMINREKTGLRGGILADQMGLGKTIQSLALIFQDGVQKRTTLVICPAVLSRQWKEETINKVKNARVLNYHERRVSGHKLQKYDVVFTTYHRVVAEYKLWKSINKDPLLAKRRAPLFSFEWQRVILDEAHQIRNRETKASMAVAYIPTIRRWCLTGTPIQNKIEDTYPYLRFLHYPQYQKWKEFKSRIVRSDLGTQRLRVILKDICLRRTKETEINNIPIYEAPPREDVLHQCSFSEEEKEFYEHVQKRTQLKFEKFMRRDPIKRQMFILALLTQLRQAACHPHLIRVEKDGKNDEESSSDSDENEDEAFTFTNVNRRKRNRRFIVESDDDDDDDKDDNDDNNRVDPVEAVNRNLPSDFAMSTKIQKALDIIRGTPASEKFIIFSCFTKFLDILDSFLAAEGIQTHYFTGKVSMNDRHEILRNFSLDNNRVLLMSLRCGALGLNLTCASQVILMDPWWNPAMEDQAGDRVHRIGQTQSIKVHRIYVANSVEERILQLQERKRLLMQSVLGDGSLQGSKFKLSIKDFRLLFGLQ